MRIGRRLLVLLSAGAVAVGTATMVAAATVDITGPQAGAAACPAGSKRAVIGGKVKCLRTGQACAARYQAAYKKSGFTCVNGRLRKRPTGTPTPPPTTPPPTTPPPAPAQPGHYKGTTSQLETFEFDVNASGTAVQNLVTGQINEGCTPPGHLSGGNFSSGPGLTPITADGNFKIDFDYTGNVSGDRSTGHFTITGHFTGTTASGTLQDTTNFTFDGTAYSCGSGLQNWTASRTG